MVTVAVTKSRVATVWGELGSTRVEVMLDSGSSVSLVQQQVLSRAGDVEQIEGEKHLQLVTASGAPLPILGHIRSSIQVGEIELVHSFVVVRELVAPVILGVDFLHDNGLVLDFTQSPVQVHRATAVMCSCSRGGNPRGCC